MPELPISGVPLLHSFARLGVFAALTVLAGAWAFRALVLVPALAGWDIADAWAAVATRRVAGLGAAAAGGLLLGAVVRGVAQVLEFLVPGDAVADALRFLILETTWGHAWLAQVALGLAAIFLFRAARTGASRSWRLAGLVVALACATPAFSGHANGVEGLRALSLFADAAHVLAAACWIGALAALFCVTAVRVEGGPEASEVLRRLLPRFSPLAMTSALVLSATGVGAAVLHLPAWSDLFGSTWGRVLLAKLVLVAGVAAIGFHHWRRATPALDAGGEVRGFVRTIAGELGLALLVLAATALLTASPLPGE